MAPASDQQLFTPVFETLVNTVLRAVERRSAATGLPLDPPLLLLLDEAANIAPLRRPDRVASAGANQGIVTISAWQDEGQIVAVYGRDRARTVLSNHTSRMYLPGVSDEQTLRALSAAIGDHQVRRVTETRDATTARRSRSAVPHDEPVAPVEWLRRLPDGEAIVLTGRHKPMRLRAPGWYEDPALRALVDPRVAAAFDRQFALS
jgi:type IV secretion system protein VirD4